MNSNFRQNYFGDQIAQPGASRSEIDDIMCNLGCMMAEITSVELFPEAGADENFGCGGQLYLEGEDDEGDPVEVTMSFDGFATNSEAREWLLDIGVLPSQIEEHA